VKISNYIKDILYTHNQVAIPEFGTFIRKMESAKISESKKVIEAPKAEILFDSTLISDDNILSNYLVQNGQVTPMEAQQLIQNYVSELRELLANNGVEEFDQIGNIRYNAHSELVFSKDTKSSFLPDTFALTELTVDPIEVTETIPAKEEKKKKPIGIFIAIAAAIIVILIVVFPVRNYLNEQEAKKIAAELKENDSINENIYTSESEENIVVEENTEEIKEVVDASIKFHIIAGSFGEIENAESLKKDLEAKGYKSSVLPQDGQWFRVSMAGFPDRKLAEEEMKKINSSSTGLDVWLYTVK